MRPKKYFPYRVRVGKEDAIIRCWRGRVFDCPSALRFMSHWRIQDVRSFIEHANGSVERLEPYWA